MIKGIIFDMDGVLLDTAKYHFESWKYLAKSLGHGLEDKIGEQLKGINRNASLDIVLEACGLSGNLIERQQWMDIKNDRFLESLPANHQDIILDGVLNLLQEISDKQIPKAVASSSKNAHYILEKTGLSRWFVSILDANDTVHSKPHPEVFINTARELRLQEHECLVIEDSYKGVEAAIRGGFPVIGIGDSKVLASANRVIENLSSVSYKKLISDVV